MRKKLTSAGFQSPNFTQTPNDFFSLMPDMEDSELRVTLVMIRSTFGFHRKGFKMGVKKLAGAAGLSLNGARAGADMAEIRGTFRRTNPDAQGEAEWELIVEDAVENWGATSEREGVQPVNTPRSTTAPQSPVKESIKEINKSTTTTKPNTFTLYEQNIGPLTPIISDELQDLEKAYSEIWVGRAIKEATESNARNLRYIRAVLAGYKERGSPDIGRDKTRNTYPRGKRPTQPAPVLQFDAQGNLIS